MSEQSEPTFADTLQAMVDAAYQRGWEDHAVLAGMAAKSVEPPKPDHDPAIEAEVLKVEDKPKMRRDVHGRFARPDDNGEHI